jgi:hypothetical protein
VAVVDRRYISGRVSAIGGEKLQSTMDLTLKAVGVYTRGWMDAGEGWEARIHRKKFGVLYDAFPDAPKTGEAAGLVKSMGGGRGMVIWGAGTVGLNAAENVHQMGKTLSYIDVSQSKLDEAVGEYGGSALRVSKEITAEEKEGVVELLSSDRVDALVIGVLKPGAPAAHKNRPQKG